MLPASIQDIMKRKLKGTRKYCPKIRSFALTLHFYSPRAYSYVRSVWKKLLPHPSTIRQWYKVIDGAPGFTDESLNAIKLKVEEMKKNNRNLFVNLVIDEMCLHEQLVYHTNRFYGGVEFGNECLDGEPVTLAKYALVFMAVAINDHWKVPVGYFLISSLTGKERADLLVHCIELLKGTGAHIQSITFDGAPNNTKMCKVLGASFDLENFKPYFTLPNSTDKIYIFYDICHMIKLVRNTLGHKKILKYKGKKIEWRYIESLYLLQKEEGLRLANKLTKKHIYFDNNIMNVKVACQTLSASVEKSLTFLRLNNYQNFLNSEATAEFCKMFNDIFDCLNCKNQFSKVGFKIPLNFENFNKLHSFAQTARNYILNLRHENNCLTVKDDRRAGFVGILVNLENIFLLFNDLNNLGLSYLLPYKLNQDYLETFFSAVRARGGFCNNPNAFQFQTAYKRLLLRLELKEFDNGNVLFDKIDILHASSSHIKESIEMEDDNTENYIIFDHDYLETLWTLSPFVDSVITYIAGYTVAKILKTSTCTICAKHLISEDYQSLLINLKRYSERFLEPSQDVIYICREAEKNLRRLKTIPSKNPSKYLEINILKTVDRVFMSEIMLSHIKEMDFFDNHRILLIKKVINVFLNVRLHYEGKKASEKDKYIRQKLHNLIQYRHQ